MLLQQELNNVTMLPQIKTKKAAVW